MKHLSLLLTTAVFGVVSAGATDALVKNRVYDNNGDTAVELALKIRSEAAPADTLLPYRYIIEYSGTGPNNISLAGFLAYFDGNFYNFNGNEWREYHFDKNPESFAPAGYVNEGVQTKNSFAELVPLYVTQKIRQSRRSPSSDVKDGDGKVVVSTYNEQSGTTLSESTFTLTSDSLPLTCDIIRFPGMEEYETKNCAEWTYVSDAFPADVTFTDASIREYMASEIAKFAPVSFDRLKGRALPSFSAKMSPSGRMQYQTGTGFSAPTVIAIFEDASPESRAALECLTAGLPEGTDLMAVFRSNRADEIGELTAEFGLKSFLFSANRFVEELELTAFPALIFVNTDGSVADVLLPTNNDSYSVVNTIAKTLK